MVRCDRARQWASSRIDGEISELESLRLDRHVAGCDACRQWLTAVEGTALLLRSDPPFTPVRRLHVPRRRAPAGSRPRLVAIAAALALAVAASIVGIALSRPGAPVEDQSPQLSFLRRPAPSVQQPEHRPLPRQQVARWPVPEGAV
jgi:anti-sigma factor RsiW